MKKLIRGAVSKKKKRFIDDNYNLDLAYIGDRIIAMGFPSFGFESVYRNDYNEVKKFLDERHGKDYFVYNLCSERDYDKACFEDRVEKFPFDDHNPPEFDLIRQFCVHAKAWLDENPEHVVVVHCKAGKGRTGCMICALMLHMEMFSSADESLTYYGQERTSNAKGVTIPSQRRYIKYYQKYIESEPDYSQPIAYRPCFVTKLIFINVPSSFFGSDLKIQIMKIDETVVYEGLGTSPKGPNLQRHDNTMSYELGEIEVTGDFRVAAIKKGKVVWFMWFNSNYVIDGEDFFRKVDIDKANKDKKFSPDFKMCIFTHH